MTDAELEAIRKRLAEYGASSLDESVLLRAVDELRETLEEFRKGNLLMAACVAAEQEAHGDTLNDSDELRGKLADASQRIECLEVERDAALAKICAVANECAWNLCPLKEKAGR
jgi:hypothetical protein